MNLKAEIRAAADPGLVADGEIFPITATSTTPPTVSDVEIGSAKSSWFSLESGKWVYKFHVGAGSGSFEVWVVDARTGTEVAHDSFDTKYGYAGKALSIQVP